MAMSTVPVGWRYSGLASVNHGQTLCPPDGMMAGILRAGFRHEQDYSMLLNLPGRVANKMAMTFQRRLVINFQRTSCSFQFFVSIATKIFRIILNITPGQSEIFTNFL